MRLALISDIHGNLAALEAALTAIEQAAVGQIVCLGDVASTGPQPRETLRRVRGLGCPVVMGNADAELIAPSSPHGEADGDVRRFLDMTAWAATQLDEDDREFLASFQPTVSVDLGATGRLLCCHGSPRSYDDVIRAATPDEEVVPMMAGIEDAIVAGGHTHERMLRGWRGRELINPGSIGLAYQFLPDGAVRVPPFTEYAIVTNDDDAISVDFRRVPYDRAATVRAMVESGMPHADWWAEGWG